MEAKAFIAGALLVLALPLGAASQTAVVKTRAGVAIEGEVQGLVVAKATGSSDWVDYAVFKGQDIRSIDESGIVAVSVGRESFRPAQPGTLGAGLPIDDAFSAWCILHLPPIRPWTQPKEAIRLAILGELQGASDGSNAKAARIVPTVRIRTPKGEVSVPVAQIPRAAEARPPGLPPTGLSAPATGANPAETPSKGAPADFMLKAPAELKASHNLLIGLPVSVGGVSKQYTVVILVYEAEKLDWLGLDKPTPSASLSDGSEVPASYVAFAPTGWTATGGQMPKQITVSQAIARPIGGKQMSLSPALALEPSKGIDFRLDGGGPSFLWYLFPVESADKVNEFRIGKVSLLRKK